MNRPKRDKYTTRIVDRALAVVSALREPRYPFNALPNKVRQDAAEAILGVIMEVERYERRAFDEVWLSSAFQQICSENGIQPTSRKLIQAYERCMDAETKK